jgi:hypothetical protein
MATGLSTIVSESPCMSSTPDEPSGRRRLLAVVLSGSGLAWFLTIALCLAHAVGVVVGMGGWSGILSPWPPTHHDHPQHFHNARMAGPLFRISGFDAGYDPSFMAGYGKSIISDSSSTLSDVTVGLLGSGNPALAYKLYVLVATAGVPWLIVAAALVWRAGPVAIAVSVLFFLLYVWTDFPIGYTAIGMIAYFLVIPLALLVTAVLTVYIERGGWWWWVASAFGSAFLVMVHITSPMIVVPAAGLAYLAGALGARRAGTPFPASRHLGIWLIPVVVLAFNVFWWLPAVRLAATKGRTDLAFSHPESVIHRLWEVVTSESPIEVWLWGGAVVGLAVLAHRGREKTFALAGFLGAGFCWGYLAGWNRALDMLQPGRQTYALYTSAALATGIGGAEVLSRLAREGRGRLDRWAILGLLILGCRNFESYVAHAIRTLPGATEPFISAAPSQRLRRIISLVENHVRPGERLLYEEGGAEKQGIPDIFRGERGSGLIPYFVPGVEVLGGPFLHVTQTTNFTQFGEGLLFGKENWDREHFFRYARLYRPAAIVCWSPRARAFCKENPDLISIRDDDGIVLFGRVLGFEGATIEGTADVEAQPGRLVVRNAVPGRDGTVVLRYHSVPLLRATPAVSLDSVYLEKDPVPFIRFKPPSGPLTIEIRFGSSDK